MCLLSPHSLHSVHIPGLLSIPGICQSPASPRGSFSFVIPSSETKFFPNSPLTIQFSAVMPPHHQALFHLKKWEFQLFSLCHLCPITVPPLWQSSLFNLTYVFIISSLTKMKEGALMFLTTVSPTENIIDNQKLFFLTEHTQISHHSIFKGQPDYKHRQYQEQHGLHRPYVTCPRCGSCRELLTMWGAFLIAEGDGGQVPAYHQLKARWSTARSSTPWRPRMSVKLSPEHTEIEGNNWRGFFA